MIRAVRQGPGRRQIAVGGSNPAHVLLSLAEHLGLEHD